VKDYLRLLVDLIVGIAWPVVALVAFITLRRQIRGIAASVVERITASRTGAAIVGPIELRWTEVIAESTQTIERLPAPVVPRSLDARRDVAVLTSSAAEQPGVAIIEGYEQVRTRLVHLLGDSGGYRNRNSDINAYELARLAASSGLLDDAVADTVGHITVLRNLATNLSAGRIDAEQATEYVKLVEEVLYRIPA
jgi:hypothetical protein